MAQYNPRNDRELKRIPKPEKTYFKRPIKNDLGKIPKANTNTAVVSDKPKLKRMGFENNKFFPKSNVNRTSLKFAARRAQINNISTFSEKRRQLIKSRYRYVPRKQSEIEMDVKRKLKNDMRQKQTELADNNVGAEAGFKGVNLAVKMGGKTGKSAYKQGNQVYNRKKTGYYEHKKNLNKSLQGSVNQITNSKFQAKKMLYKARWKSFVQKQGGGNAAKAVAKRIGSKLLRMILSKAVIIPVVCLVVLSMGMSMLTSCATGAAGSMAAVLNCSYLADEQVLIDTAALIDTLDMEFSERYLTLVKTESESGEYTTVNFIQNPIIQTDYVKFLAYMTVLYDDYTLTYETENFIRNVHSSLYEIKTEVVEEVVQVPIVKPVEGVSGEFETTYEEQEVKYLNITIEARNVDDLTASFSEEQKERYDFIVSERGNTIYQGTFGNPLKYDWSDSVSSENGWRYMDGEKEYHAGLDITTNLGTELVALCDGEIINTGTDMIYGNYVILQNKDNYKIRYAHCDSITATVGQAVKKGDLIAYSGNTGRSTGAHLHIDIEDNYGVKINPAFKLGCSAKGK